MFIRYRDAYRWSRVCTVMLCIERSSAQNGMSREKSERQGLSSSKAKRGYRQDAEAQAGDKSPRRKGTQWF